MQTLQLWAHAVHAHASACSACTCKRMQQVTAGMRPPAAPAAAPPACCRAAAAAPGATPACTPPFFQKQDAVSRLWLHPYAYSAFLTVLSFVLVFRAQVGGVWQLASKAKSMLPCSCRLVCCRWAAARSGRLRLVVGAFACSCAHKRKPGAP